MILSWKPKESPLCKSVLPFLPWFSLLSANDVGGGGGGGSGTEIPMFLQSIPIEPANHITFKSTVTFLQKC